ncbi:RagB/SusD family nutrient uptake outer membrane protein [Chitinophaga sp. G-6-1-13]|uniref:RagB/SusD family nutrient uptake outer membrane protein n=1 Tax=Chitinophaga fulva TaxID=2728842 RepID=A0A848GQ99_9BACT|nr:RagB/SusD family nutrient uptake outer membrane protein [Chitinophaga fulva]NML40706.1 RagB/SusD family nutrient uptake outer membrane protein [Chitinophaga fulva]
MKKKNIYHIIGLLLLSLLLGSCKKYFEVNPDMRTELDTPEKVGELLVTAYPTADYFLFAELASDNSVDKGPGDFSLNDIARDSYLWKEVSQVSDSYSPNTYWLDMYRAIAAANHAIEAVDENNFGTKGRQYKGEALLTRAYAHHMLVSLFSKAYQVNGDNSSPGVPYLTVPEKNAFQNYDRGTVASVYEHIEKDLLEGMRLIKGISYKSPKFHFNEQAANAFAARFYLFKGEYDKVIQYASAIFPENNFKQNLRPIAGALKAAGSNSPALFTGSQQNFNLLLANVYSNFNNIAAGGRYGAGLPTEQMISGNTVAGKQFYQYYTRIGGIPDKLSLGKYPTFSYRASTFATDWTYYTIQCLFSADEALMNRAEAYINTGDYASALKDLNDFAEVRIDGYNVVLHGITESKVLSFYNTTDIRAGLLKTVLDFKQKAFAHEGIRWLDINRYGLEISHRQLDNKWDTTYDVLKKDDLRRVFQLPQSATLSGLTKNPR